MSSPAMHWRTSSAEVTEGSQALPITQPTCCPFILSFMQHSFQSLLSLPDSTEALGIGQLPTQPCPAPVQFLMTAHLLQGLHDTQKMQFKCSGITAPSLFPALSCTFLINPHIQPEGSQHHPRPDLCCLSNSYVYLSPTQSCLLK